MVKKDVVLCFSGGIDSTAGLHYLKARKEYNVIPIYFDLKTKYSEKEIAFVTSIEPNVIIDESLNWLGSLEVGEKAFVPYRNLYLAMTASAKYARSVCICGIKGDDVSDKRPEVFEEWSIHLTKLYGEDIKIWSPFWEYTKEELVKNYLSSGGKVNVLIDCVSCYADGQFSCWSCPSCFRKFVALFANKIDVPFKNIELAKRYWKDCLDGKYEKTRTETTLKVLEKYYGWKR